MGAELESAVKLHGQRGHLCKEAISNNCLKVELTDSGSSEFSADGRYLSRAWTKPLSGCDILVGWNREL